MRRWRQQERLVERVREHTVPSTKTCTLFTEALLTIAKVQKALKDPPTGERIDIEWHSKVVESCSAKTINKLQTLVIRHR